MCDCMSATLEEIFGFFNEAVEEEREDFEGEMPKQGVESLVKSSAQLPLIPKRHEVYEAHEQYDDPDREELQEAMESWFMDHLATLANLAREWDLDVPAKFEQVRSIRRATEEADDVEEFKELLQDAEIDDELIEALTSHHQHHGVETGQNVDMADYDGGDDRMFQ